MKVSVDIPYELLKEAVTRIEKKQGICKHLPNARFNILGDLFEDDEWRFSTLVCSDKMGGKSTGIGAEWCKNCITVEREESK